MLNLLTIDLEDYFQVHAFSKVIQFDDWDKFQCRIERNTDRLLSILNSVPGPQPSQLSKSAALNNSLTHSPINSECNNSVPGPQPSQLSKFAALNNSITHSPINSECNNSVPGPQPSQPQHGSTAALNSSITHSLNNSFTQRVHATFFVLGWIAERYPDLVRRIQKEGHEIACHGYAHRLVYTQSRDQFRQDVRRAKSTLEDIIGSEVVGYRAPSYSITDKSKWAFEVLVEEGFKYDSSIFPIRHDFYGLPEAPRFPFVVSLNGNDNFEFSMLSFESNDFSNSKLTIQNSQLEMNNTLTRSLINPSSKVSAPQHRSTVAPFQGFTPNSELRTQHSLVEFPISTVKLLGQNVPVSGGGYFRLFPYPLVKKGLKRINQKESRPFIFYIHPWELDPGQPRINGLSSRSNFRHYVNLAKTESRFKKLLKDFQFSPIRQFLLRNC